MPDPKPNAFSQIQNLFKRLSNGSSNRFKAGNQDTTKDTAKPSSNLSLQNTNAPIPQQITDNSKPTNNLSSTNSLNNNNPINTSHSNAEYAINLISEVYSKYLVDHLHFNVNSTKHGAPQFGKGFMQVRRELQTANLDILLSFFKAEFREKLKERVSENPQLQTGLVKSEILSYLNKNFKKHVSYLFTLHSTEKEYPHSWTSIIYHSDLDRYVRNNNLFFSRLFAQQGYGHIIAQKADEIKAESRKYLELSKKDFKEAVKYKENLFWNWVSFGLSNVYYQNGISENGKFSTKDILVHFGGGEHLTFDLKWAKVIEDGIYLKLKLEFERLVIELDQQNKKTKTAEKQKTEEASLESNKPVKIVGNLETSVGAGSSSIAQAEAIREVSETPHTTNIPSFESVSPQVPRTSNIDRVTDNRSISAQTQTDTSPAIIPQVQTAQKIEPKPTAKPIENQPQPKIEEERTKTTEVVKTDTPRETQTPQPQTSQNQAQATTTQTFSKPATAVAPVAPVIAKPVVQTTTQAPVVKPIERVPNIQAQTVTATSVKPAVISTSKLPDVKPQATETKIDFTKPIQPTTVIQGGVTQGISTKAVSDVISFSTPKIPTTPVVQTTPLVKPIQAVQRVQTQTPQPQTKQSSVVLTTDINKDSVVSFTKLPDVKPQATETKIDFTKPIQPTVGNVTPVVGSVAGLAQSSVVSFSKPPIVKSQAPIIGNNFTNLTQPAVGGAVQNPISFSKTPVITKPNIQPQISKTSVVLTTDVTVRPQVHEIGAIAGIGSLAVAGSLVNTNLTNQNLNVSSFIEIPKNPEIKQFSGTQLTSFNNVSNQFEKLGLSVSTPELGNQVNNFILNQQTLYPNKPIEASVITKEFLKTNQIQTDDIRAPQIQNLVTAFTVNNQVNSLPIDITLQNPQANALISGGLVTLESQGGVNQISQSFQTLVIPPSQVSTLSIQIPNTNQTQTITLQNTESQPMRFVFQTTTPQQTQPQIISAQIFKPVISQTPQQIGITSYFQTNQATNTFNPNTKFVNTANLTPITVNATNLYSTLSQQTSNVPQTTVLNGYQGANKILQTQSLQTNTSNTQSGLGKINLANNFQKTQTQIQQANSSESSYGQFKEYGSSGYNFFTPTTKNARTPKKALILNQAQADRYVDEDPKNRVLKYQEDTRNGEPVYIVLANSDDYLLEYGTNRTNEEDQILNVEDLDEAEASSTINKLYDISNSKMEESKLAAYMPAFAEEYFPEQFNANSRTNIGQNKSEILGTQVSQTNQVNQTSTIFPNTQATQNPVIASPFVLPNLTTGLNLPPQNQTQTGNASNTFKPNFNPASLKTEPQQPKAQNNIKPFSQKTTNPQEIENTDNSKEVKEEPKEETKTPENTENLENTENTEKSEAKNNIKNFNRKEQKEADAKENNAQDISSKEGQKTATMDGADVPADSKGGNVATLDRPKTDEQTQTNNQQDTQTDSQQATNQQTQDQTQEAKANREALERSYQNSGNPGEGGGDNEQTEQQTNQTQGGQETKNKEESDQNQDQQEQETQEPQDQQESQTQTETPQNNIKPFNNKEKESDLKETTSTDQTAPIPDKAKTDSDKLAQDKLEKATGKRVPFGDLRDKAKGKINDFQNQAKDKVKEVGTKAYDATVGKGVNAVKAGAGKIANKASEALAKSPVGKSIGNVANRVSALAGKAQAGAKAVKNTVGKIGKGIEMARDAKAVAKDAIKDLAKNAIMAGLRSAAVTFGPWIAGAIIAFTIFFAGPAIGAGLSIQQAYCEKQNNQVANLARNIAEGLVFNDKKLEASAALLLGQKLAIESEFGKKVAKACGVCTGGTGPSGANDGGQFVAGSYKDFEGNITKAFLALGYTDPNQLAYLLATVSHESGDGKYCEEIGGRQQAIRLGYSGGENFFGRGYVQLTHDYNYKKFSKVLGVDLAANPGALCQPENAARVAVIGSMQREFSFTGVILPDYIDSNKKDFYNARKVINGLDAASSIATIAENYANKAPQLIAQYKGGGGGTSNSSTSSSKSANLNMLDPMNIVAQSLFGQIDARASKANPESPQTGLEGLGNTKIPPEKITQLKQLESSSKLRKLAPSDQASRGLLNIALVDWFISMGTQFEYISINSLNDGNDGGPDGVHSGTGHGNGVAVDLGFVKMPGKQEVALQDFFMEGKSNQKNDIIAANQAMVSVGGVKVIYAGSVASETDQVSSGNPKIQPAGGHSNHWHVQVEVDGKITTTSIAGPPGSNTTSSDCQCGGSGTNTPSTGGGNGSKDTGVGANGVKCLASPRTGVMADPYARAIARALKFYENSDSYTGTPNELGCVGAYQFCPRGAWEDTLPKVSSNPTRYNNVQLPSSPSQMSPEQQDYAFAAYFDVRFPTGFNDLKNAGNDRAKISSIMESQEWCKGWTPFGATGGSPGCPKAESKRDPLIETYLNVLVEELTGKCGTQTAKLDDKNKDFFGTTTIIAKTLFGQIDLNTKYDILAQNLFGGIDVKAAGPGSFVYNGEDKELLGLISSGKVGDVIQQVSAGRPSLPEQINSKSLTPNAIKALVAVAKSGKFDSVRVSSAYRSGDSGDHGAGIKFDIDAVTYKGQLYTHMSANNGDAGAVAAFVELAHAFKDTGVLVHIISGGAIHDKIKSDSYMSGVKIVQDDSRNPQYGAIHEDHYDLKFNETGTVGNVGSGSASTTGSSSANCSSSSACSSPTTNSTSSSSSNSSASTSSKSVYNIFNPINAYTAESSSATSSASTSSSQSSSSSTPNCSPVDGKGATQLLAKIKQMSTGKQPLGQCFAAVGDAIDAVGFGGIGGPGKPDVGTVMAQAGFSTAEARNFAEFLNAENGKYAKQYGIVNLLDSNPNINPYNAPVGSIVVVSAGSPGTSHPTAGDIVVKNTPTDDNSSEPAFYNDGEMGYKGPDKWSGSKANPPYTGKVLGVYVLK